MPIFYFIVLFIIAFLIIIEILKKFCYAKNGIKQIIAFSYIKEFWRDRIF